MRTHILLTGCLSACLLAGGAVAREKKAKVLFNPKYDPEAARMDVFEGVDRGMLAVQMRPRDEWAGSIYIENLTDQPLTVELPDVIVGVQVLPQVGVQFQIPGGVGLNGNQQQQFGQGQGPGQNQPVGGTANGNSNGVSNGNRSIPGLFSVPPERTARIEYSSVCLLHEASQPRSGNLYRLVPVDQYSDDVRLAQLLRRVGQPGENTVALQAAAWHIANGMTWEDLQGKRRPHLNAPSEPYFVRGDLQTAQAIVSDIETQLANRESSPHRTTGIDAEVPRLTKAGR